MDSSLRAGTTWAGQPMWFSAKLSPVLRITASRKMMRSMASGTCCTSSCIRSAAGVKDSEHWPEKRSKVRAANAKWLHCVPSK